MSAEIFNHLTTNTLIGPILAMTALGALQRYRGRHNVIRVPLEACERKCCKVRLRAVLVGFAVVGALLGSALGTQAKPAQQSAFLTEYAGSVQEVIQQVEANRLVALRYAKHFRMDPASVLVYFRNELSLATLDESASLVVYFIGDSSQIDNETRAFKKGTKVFVDRQGVPILEFGTGNPLGTSIEPASSPADQLHNPGSTQETPGPTLAAQPAQPQPGPTNPVVSPTDTTIPGITTPNISPTALPTPSPTASPTVIASTPPAGDGGPLIPEINHSRSSSWVAPLGLAGALAALAGGGGSSGSSGSSENPKTDGSGVVPEPVSMTMMATGFAAFASGIMYRRRKTK